MKIASLLLLFVCALLYPHAWSQSAGWRGIVPLHSTRADVERVLGKPNLAPDVYDLGNERASIMYTNDPCTEGWQGSYSVPRDTVLSIYVVPQYDLALADLHLDLSKYKRAKDEPAPNHSTYQNDDEGIAYLVDETGSRGKDVVRRILYNPRAEDARLHCPVPAGQTNADNDARTKAAGEGTEAFGECPTVDIEGSSDKTPQAGVYLLTAYISGGSPRFTPTFKWSVSAGVIASGQGTPSVKIDTNGTDCRQITVTLEVGGVMPKGCERIKTHTIEHSKP
jgi:ferredoxin